MGTGWEACGFVCLSVISLFTFNFLKGNKKTSTCWVFHFFWYFTCKSRYLGCQLINKENPADRPVITNLCCAAKHCSNLRRRSWSFQRYQICQAEFWGNVYKMIEKTSRIVSFGMEVERSLTNCLKWCHLSQRRLGLKTTKFENAKIRKKWGVRKKIY